MPLFDPRKSIPRQLLTPPEFVPSYQTGCGGMPYQQSTYSGQPSIRQHDDGYDFSDRYGQLAIAMPPMYPQSGTYLSGAPPNLPPASSFYEHAGSNILPPMRSHNGPTLGDVLRQQRPQEAPQRMTQSAKEEKPVGGVSAKLDYDMEVMTDFVCETALRIITPGRMAPQSFRKWVHQLLCATRLPSATILLSMYYLSNRIAMLGGATKTDSHLFRLLTIALVLGSKFLDDNTFINHSWSEVSGIPVADLNHMETEWLVEIDFKLHCDPTEQHGWTSWSDHWKEYEAHANARSNRANKLSPIDTTVQRRSMHINQNKPLPPLPMQQQAYNPPPPPYEYTPKSAQPSYNSASGYPQYDPWRSASESSPSSAPTTGPTTPEYYGASGAWAPAEGYSRRTMFGFPPLSLPAASQSQQPSNYGPSTYSAPYSTPAWSPTWGGHEYNCACLYCCANRHGSYMLRPYAPQAVAV